MSDPHERIRSIPSAHDLSVIPENMHKAIRALELYYGGDVSPKNLDDLERYYKATEGALDNVQSDVIDLLIEIREIIGDRLS